MTAVPAPPRPRVAPARVARALGVDTAGLPGEAAADAAADIETLAVTTTYDACLSTNPREADAADMAALFRAAL